MSLRSAAVVSLAVLAGTVFVLLFGAAAFGALTASYLHLADWWRAWMPEGWEQLAFVAALVTEGVIVACGLSRALVMRKGDEGYESILRLELAAVALSIYVNARWGAANKPGAGLWWGLDVLAGSAAQPLFAVACLGAMGFVLRKIGALAAAQLRRAEAKATKARGAKASAPAKADEGAEAKESGRKHGGRLSLAERWALAVETHGTESPAEIAAHEGVTPQAVRGWRRAAQEG